MVIERWRDTLKITRHITTLDLLKKEKRMKVRMLRTFKASSDGINIQTLEEGKKYDLPESQARRYLDRGLAELDKAHEGPSETKEKKVRRKKIKEK